MRVYRVWLGLLVLALAFSASGALAQSGEQTYEGLISFTYPASWQIQVSNPNQIQLTQDDATITFYGPERIAILRAQEPKESAADFMDRFLDSLSLSIDEPIELVGNLLAGGTVLINRNQVGVALLVEAGPDAQVVILLRADTQAANDLVPEFAAIVDSLTASAVTTSASGEPCMISAAEAGTATVRVGPGENRTAITFLPADTLFSVLGVGEASDGSQWWKLDKAEVAPQSAAAELWVAQDEVSASGDCAAVGAAEAPPIIPITAPQPSGGGSANPPASGGPVASSGGGRSGVFITLAEWQSGLPASLQAAGPQRARIIVNVSQSLTTVENCGDYTNSLGQTIQIVRNKVVYTAQANDGGTGQPLGPAAVFMGGDPPGCPSTIMVNSTLNGPPPSVGDAVPWLQSLLGG